MTLASLASEPAPAPAPLEERIALIEAFANENEDTVNKWLYEVHQARTKKSCVKIEYIKQHPGWVNKYGTKGMKHFKKSLHKDSNYSSYYTQFLPKITEQKSLKSSIKTQEQYLYLLDDKKLISFGGDPYLPEKEGGLSLAFIFKYIHNSGLQPNSPQFFHTCDNGRVISNIFKRVWRIVNKYN